MRITKVLALVALTAALTACGSSSGGGSTTAVDRGDRAVAPVPPGYHAITPSIVVADVDAALAFYAAALGGTTRERIEGPGGAIMHAEVLIGDSIVMIGPEAPEQGQRAPTSAGGSNGGLFVYVEDVDATVARATAAGATVIMPATDMFWGDRYAQVRDPQGHFLSLATHRFELTPEEIATRGQAFMAAMASGGAPPAFEGGQPATSWKPEGYFVVTPELVVSGPEVIDFYVRAFGAIERERVLLPDGRLMHGEIQIGDSIVMLGGEMLDQAPDMKTPDHLGAATMTLHHYVADADTVFARATEAGATAQLPITDMFWGDRFGMVTDPSHQGWSIATHVRDVTPEEMQAAMSSGAQ